MKRSKKTFPNARFSLFSHNSPISESPQFSRFARSLAAAPFAVALGSALFVGGCSSDSLKRPFSTTANGPTSTGAAPLADATTLPAATTASGTTVSPASTISANAAPTIVSGVDYVEANAAATPPLGTAISATSLSSNYANSPNAAVSSSPASFPPYPNAATTNVAPSSDGEIRDVFLEETRLREELIAARADVKRQIDANESLLRQSATLRRDAEEAVAELRRENAELAEKNRVLLASASELQAERSLNERRLQIQNAALRKAPTTVVVPNNSAANLDLKLSDPKILPIRRDGDAPTIELQDALLFEPNDSTRLSDEGKTRLRILATEILRRYPTNVLSIQGHSDADPTRLDDPLNVQAESVQKAYLVAEFLAEETGVARNQTIVGGCGAVRPIVSNETETNRRRNRRVEIAILPETVVPSFDPPQNAKTVAF